MSQPLIAALDRFRGRRVLVLGDIMLDEYLRGTVQRISPEAPVPIVQVSERECLPGGAANVATNLRALGADVRLCAITGSDSAGRELRDLLEARSIDCSGVVETSSRPTTVKTRIIAHNQQVVRVDRESEDDLDPSDLQTLSERVGLAVNEVDAVLLQDYDKGVLTDSLLKSVLAESQALGRIVTVDPRRRRFFHYQGVTLFKPNRREAEDALGWSIRSPEDEERAASQLLEQLEARFVLLTLGERGMLLAERDSAFTRIPPWSTREVFDVTGAGDTVISAVTLGLAAGIAAGVAARIASVAAGIKVGKLGAVPVERSELVSALESID